MRRPYGDVEVEGDSLDEVVEGLQTFPEWLAVIDRLMPSIEGEKMTLTGLEGLVETTPEGPQLTVSKDRISSKEAISLLLYSKDPSPMEPKEIGRLLNLSGHGSSGFGSRLSEMRREGLLVKEGEGYRLSASGRRFVEELVERLRGEETVR
ncbi:MAG: hypothetical protein QXF26_04405 [Candidatus Bathyarchaeia archaeon]